MTASKVLPHDIDATLEQVQRHAERIVVQLGGGSHSGETYGKTQPFVLASVGSRSANAACLKCTEAGADTVMVTKRPVLAPAMLAYALSFGLPAVSRDFASLGIPGYMCAWVTLWNTLVVADRFQGKTIVFIALLISGWINILFLVSMAIRWLEGNLGFKILRIATLLMIPFCWIIFYDQRLVPREGHVLWIVGMVLALFSDSLSSSGGVRPTPE